MQRAFGTAAILRAVKRNRGFQARIQREKPQNHSASLGATLLRHRQRFIEPRFAAIRSIFVDDPALGGFIDG
jgi:hypothetical protein